MGSDESGDVIVEHFDAQDDRLAIGFYADTGVGPAVVFDGGGFTDHRALTAFANDLLKAARSLYLVQKEALDANAE